VFGALEGYRILGQKECIAQMQQLASWKNGENHWKTGKIKKVGKMENCLEN
jgi:hypothetical protein